MRVAQGRSAGIRTESYEGTSEQLNFGNGDITDKCTPPVAIDARKLSDFLDRRERGPFNKSAKYSSDLIKEAAIPEADYEGWHNSMSVQQL